MAHMRETIITQARALLFSEVPGLGGRVYTGRVHPIEDEEGALPCAVVYADGEAWDGEGAPGPVQFRWLTVVVDLYAKAADGVDFALDDLAVDVEKALGSGTGILKDLTKLVFLESSTPELVDELEQPAGRLRMEWQALYRVDTRDPEGPAQ